ncbi:MAG TPA: APC family permease [Negativicutes bacterium]|nr:APC family permease [Negativicutes bacterium]
MSSPLEHPASESFLGKFFRLLIGKALRTEQLAEEKFSVFWGLPILSSDAISSVAYASEEILYVLVPVIGLLAYAQMFHIALAIVALLFILVFSYRQTIDAYPCGGGSYIVAHDNLGVIPGLTAAATLSIDYILTVAVSSCAGTAAITSAIPELLVHRVPITLFFILILTVGNLRGIKDSSRLFGVPTYAFIVSMLAMIVYGIYKVHVGGFVPTAAVSQAPEVMGEITVFLILRAFASGCTALTGVEAVSNAIPNFQEPAQSNAKKVLFLLALIVLLIFGGTSYLATLYHAMPNPNETVVAQIASQVFGDSIMFYVIQLTTALILVMAANTSFTDLPLLLSLLAKDGYVPRQFAHRGGRLNFSNGIDFLGLAAAVLVVIFDGETHLLMPLYAVGVFASFTLSQSGMWWHWVKGKTPGWKHKAAINGFGAIITFITVLIIGATKFMHGAWIVCLLVPIFIFAMLKVKAHYAMVAEQLSLPLSEKDTVPPIDDNREKHIIVPMASLNKASYKALWYAKRLAGYNSIRAFHVAVDDAAAEKLRQKWAAFNIDVPLIIQVSPYRDTIEPLLEYIQSEEQSFRHEDLITVVIPQFVVKKWWQHLLHNQTSFFIKNRLMNDPRVAIVTVSYHLKDE